MNTEDLAWKGTTVEEKRQLLNDMLKKRAELIAAGKIKDGELGLASACVDIIGTAGAVLSNDPCPEKEEWSLLLDKAQALAKEAVEVALKTGKEDWEPSDYEVAGVILLKTQGHDAEEATLLLQKGLELAEKRGNTQMELFLWTQLMRANMMGGFTSSVETCLDVLTDGVRKETDPLVLTRVYRAVAEGAKYLAIHYAEAGNSPNQLLKAKAI